MNAPEYRKAACCLYCRNSNRIKSRCLKFCAPIDMSYVCAVFEFELSEEALFHTAKED